MFKAKPPEGLTLFIPSVGSTTLQPQPRRAGLSSISTATRTTADVIYDHRLLRSTASLVVLGLTGRGCRGATDL